MTTKRQLIIEPLPGYEPDVGRALWMLEDARRRTLNALENMPPASIDWTERGIHNSIGTLLYHIAAIELDWLAVEILENKIDAGIWAHFPYDVRDAAGRLTVVNGLMLDEHLKRLATVRSLLLESFKGMTTAEFRRPRSFPDYDVSPEEVLHHLAQHEAEHRGEILTLRTLVEGK